MSKKRASGDVVMELLVHGIESRLKANGVASDEAMQIAVECSEEVRANWGGGHIYVPKGVVEAFRGRNHEIWNEFDGSNYKELARKHDLTEMRIRQIIAWKRREMRT